MQAIILHGKESISLGEFPTPELHAGEVCVAVAYCGICGSDYHKYEGKQNTHPIRYPVPLGHEISGVVVKVGDNTPGFSVGDRVTVDPNWSCGKCRFCQEGKPSFCENARGVVKGMADYVVSPVENVYRLPDSLKLRTAALAEPLSCCLHGMDLLDIRQGETVALVGFGAIGAIMLGLIRHAGAGEIIVIEPNEEKRALAMEMGATRFLSPLDQAAVAELADQSRITRVMECVGNSRAQATALSVAGKGATVVFFGVSDAKETLPFSVYDAFLKELTVKTSFVNPRTTRRAVALLATDLMDWDRLISAELSMEEALEEIRHPHYSRMGKVLVRIHPEIEETCKK
ncbi:MAG: alcohol dehydrogenase catalytic domain-containing protein [Clostridia bacterium]|nr:alcohol dehydrogenase catalytic domain-containing protein [Clostridia bacterium]